VKTLLSYRYENVTISQALRCWGRRGFLHAMGRSDAGFGIADNEGKLWLDGVCLDGNAMDSLFEIRVFDEHAELRWLRNANLGTCVLVAENSNDFTEAASALPGLVPTKTERAFTDSVSLNYFVWGESVGLVGDGPSGIWTKLSNTRIGSQLVPIEAATGSLVVVNACEYIGIENQFGNAAVIEERWLGLASILAENAVTKSATEGTEVMA
jgi:CRISPR-associated protein (TIGR03984 family)